MAGESRTINAIVVPIKSDVGPFSKGLSKAHKDAEKFSRDTTRQFSLMGSGIRDSIGKAQQKLDALGKTNLGTVTQGLAGLAAAAVASAGAIATIGFKHIGDVGKSALELGVGAEALSRLRGVARATGTDFSDLAEFIKGLTNDINDGIGKTTQATEAFKSLGTSAEALQKLTPDEQIKALNKGFAALPNDAERAKTSMLLAGAAGVKVFRLLSLGTADFKREFDNALIVTDDDVSEIRKLQVAIDKIGASVQALADIFTTKVAPAITSVASLLSGLASKFGVTVAAVSKPIPVPKVAAANVPAPNPAPQMAMQAALAQKAADAAKAQAAATQLQIKFDKQADQIARTKTRFVPSTNGMGMRLSKRNQTQIDTHTQTGQELNAANATAKRLADEAKSQTKSMTDAIRLNQQLMADVAALKQDYRATIEGAGKDDVTRRVDQIKGLSVDQRKQLLQQGYQAREAGKTSSLRDELQESTRLPIDKLRDDLSRIDRMAKLGAANGGLSRTQAIRAAAQKTAESGLGGPTQFAGALQANSIEGRSYLLSQMQMQANDPVAVAKQGLVIAGQQNTALQGILRAVTNQREMTATF